jgi:hypothetical protein
MNPKMLSRRSGMLLAIAVAAVIPAHVGAKPLAAAPQAATVLAQGPAVVVDNSAVAPLDLMLFVHRPDLPLRAVPPKHKDHS